MFYFDFGEDTFVRTAYTRKKLKQYSAFSAFDLAPLEAKFKARSIVFEKSNGRCEWVKNRWHAGKELDDEELKQFMFQKLASTIIL